MEALREVACCDQGDDGDGLTDTRVMRFEYDPRFGSSGDRYLLGLREYDPLKQYLPGDTVVYNQKDPLLPDILVCRPAIAPVLLNAIMEATHAI